MVENLAVISQLGRKRNGTPIVFGPGQFCSLNFKLFNGYGRRRRKRERKSIGTPTALKVEHSQAVPPVWWSYWRQETSPATRDDALFEEIVVSKACGKGIKKQKISSEGLTKIIL